MIHNKYLTRTTNIFQRYTQITKYTRAFHRSASFGQKFSILKNSKSGKPISDVSYEEESSKYISKELLKFLKAFSKENQKLSEISVQFKEVLQLYGLTLQKAPLKEPVPFCEEAIHLTKQVDHINLNLLLDYRVASETDAREVQLIATSENNFHVFYCMGQFNKEEGVLFDSAMVIDTKKIGKSPEELRNAICNGEKWVFSALNNHYQKPLEVSLESVRKFLLSENGDDYDFSDMTGRVFVDALLNYFLLGLLNMRATDPDGAKLIKILWLLANYSETCLQERWISNLLSFVK